MTVNIIKTKWRWVMCLLLTGKMIMPVMGQEGTADIKSFLQKLQQAYQHASYLSFGIKYFYANQNQLSRHLDSLQGEVQMDKGHCRFVLDEVETVVTDNYTIQVRKEDKSIYLSEMHGRNTVNPLSLVDSMLAHLDGIQATASGSAQSETLTIVFPPGQPYTQIIMTRSKQTGFLSRIVYALNTEKLVGQEQIDRPGHPGLYQQKGQIEMIFSNYRQRSFNESLFDEANFFAKINGRFEPAGKYKGYQIYNTSLNQ